MVYKFMPRKLVIKKGEKFNRLTIIKEVKSHILPCGIKERKVLCLCDCGNKTEIFYNNLKRGKSKSCGCLRKEIMKKISYKHGMTGYRFFNIWCKILQRCNSNNKNNKNYYNYKYRGITVCKEWLKFKNFKQNMYESYLKHCEEFGEKNTQIERINNDLGYYKQNCKWATLKEQANNTRKNVFITYKNKTQTLAQWSNELNINYNTLYGRLNRSIWSIEKAFIKICYKRQ